jgi:hypothetical protein
MPDPRQPEVKPRPVSFYVLLGAGLFVFIETFSLLSPFCCLFCSSCLLRSPSIR